MNQTFFPAQLLGNEASSLGDSDDGNEILKEKGVSHIYRTV